MKYLNDKNYRQSVKNIHQQMKNLAIQGIGISPWEAEVLIDTIEEVYFSDPILKDVKPGQLKYQCISEKESAGKSLKDCQMVTVTLTLFDENDKKDISSSANKDSSIEIRRRRISRISEEAKEQKGFLSQEDLAELLMCDVRTIRRDIKALKEQGIIIPTRGQQKDIGPGVSHRAVAISLWLEGKEPIEICRHIKHSIKAVENYLQKFKRVVYLKMKNFNKFEIALTVGISIYATSTFLELYEKFKNKKFFKSRLKEIKIVGAKYYKFEDEKKSPKSLEFMRKKWRKQ